MDKKWLYLSVSGLLLTGCSLIQSETEGGSELSQSAAIQEGDKTSETDTADNQEEIQLTEEERQKQELIASLPEDAHTEDWNLILVNNWNPLSDDFTPNLVEVEPGKMVDKRIADAFVDWKTAASEAGHNLYFASGYRSVERQQNNYDRSINQYKQEGYSEEEAIAKTEEYIAIPKSSEHHTGLAVDIVDQEWIAQGKGLIPEYDTQESQQWLISTMADYGFILRYPQGTKDLTDINYESWHFRYVGKENARFIEEHDIVLEQYIDLLKEREKQADNK